MPGEEKKRILLMGHFHGAMIATTYNDEYQNVEVVPYRDPKDLKSTHEEMGDNLFHGIIFDSGQFGDNTHDLVRVRNVFEEIKRQQPDARVFVRSAHQPKELKLRGEYEHCGFFETDQKGENPTVKMLDRLRLGQ